MKLLSCISLFTALGFQACANNPTVATAHRESVKDSIAAQPNLARRSPGVGGPDSFTVGKVIDTIACAADAEQSYAAYIPVSGNKKALPVIYFFDPHASGSLPLKKYKALADKYGF